MIVLKIRTVITTTFVSNFLSQKVKTWKLFPIKMSYFPNFLGLHCSNNWTEKSDCQIPRDAMNSLIMNYLVTGKKKFLYKNQVKLFISFLFNFVEGFIRARTTRNWPVCFSSLLLLRGAALRSSTAECYV